MNPNPSSSGATKKRRHSVSDCRPSKRFKDDTYIQCKTEGETDPEETLDIIKQCKVLCAEKKNVIDNVIEAFLKLVVHSESAVMDFKTSFDKATYSIKFLDSRIAYLRKLLETVGQNLEVWNKKLMDLEDLKIFSGKCTEKTCNEDQASEITSTGNSVDPIDSTMIEETENIFMNDDDDQQSVHSFDSQKTVLNVFLRKDRNNVSSSSELQKSTLCEETGLFVESSSQTDCESSSLNEITGSWSDLESDTTEKLDDFIALPVDDSTFSEPETDVNQILLCEQSGLYIEPCPNASQAGSEDGSYVFDISRMSTPTLIDEYVTEGDVTNIPREGEEILEYPTMDRDTHESEEILESSITKENNILNERSESEHCHNMSSRFISVLNDLSSRDANNIPHESEEILENPATNENNILSESEDSERSHNMSSRMISVLNELSSSVNSDAIAENNKDKDNPPISLDCEVLNSDGVPEDHFIKPSLMLKSPLDLYSELQSEVADIDEKPSIEVYRNDLIQEVAVMPSSSDDISLCALEETKSEAEPSVNTSSGPTDTVIKTDVDMNETSDKFYENEADNPIATDEEMYRIKNETEKSGLVVNEVVKTEKYYISEEGIKTEFFKYFGLKDVIIELSEEEEDDRDLMEIKEAFNKLLSSDDQVSHGSSLSSLSDDSMSCDENFESEVDLPIAGKIVNRLPSLPQTSDSEVDDCVEEHAIKLRDLRIHLTRLDDSHFSKAIIGREASEINRLTNLTTLDAVKHGIIPKHSRSRMLSTKPRTIESEESDDSSDDILCTDSGIINEDLHQPNDFPDLNYLDLEYIDGVLDDVVEPEITVKNKKNTFSDSDKENKGNNGSYTKIDRTPIESSKSKWKYDKLLRGNLSDSDSETDSRKRKNHQEKNNSDCDSDCNINEKASHDGRIIIDTDSYDSEIEFVSETKDSRNKFETIYSSDSDNSNDEDDDSQNLISDGSKKGRRNIREILSDEILEEATKTAALLESQRKERLSQKQKAMDCFLSQTSVDNQPTKMVLDVDDATQNSIVVVHPELTKRLKNHQKDGVRFMWESCYESVKQLKKDAGSGCILAHCMGLGKTFQVVALIHTLFSHEVTNTKHILVVCPLSIVLNWKVEFEKGLQNIKNHPVNIFKISEIDRSGEQRRNCIFRWRAKGGVLIMGYESFRCLTNFKNVDALDDTEKRIKKALVDPGPDLVILDEGHLLKNGRIDRTRSLMKLKTKRRIVLTGTPLQNNLKEYYYMVQFVKPNYLGSFNEFSNRFMNPINNGQFDDSTVEDIKKMKMRSHVLHQMLKATIQRYEVTELRNYLPRRYDYVLLIELCSVQKELYKKYIEITQEGNNKTKIFAHYNTLQSISTHPYLLNLKDQKTNCTKKKTKEVDVIHYDVDSDNAEADMNSTASSDWWKTLYPQDAINNIEYGPKFSIILTIIRESERLDEKVLIFTGSLVSLDALEHFLQQNETETSKWKPREDYYRMDGSVLPETRLQLCSSFNSKTNKRARVFLISHRVGGLGLNLIAANRVILLDVNWNPAVDHQSVFRCYRFGQTKQCYVYRLVAADTMEHVIYDRQVAKTAMSKRVVDEKQIHRHYKKEDLERLYRFNFTDSNKKTAHKLPDDNILKRVLIRHSEVREYHEHNDLLENMPEEELDDAQQKYAWEDYRKEEEVEQLKLELQKKQASAAAAAAAAAAASTSAASTSSGQPTTSSMTVNNFLPSALINQHKNTMNRIITPKSGIANILPQPNATDTTLTTTATNGASIDHSKKSEELQEAFLNWSKHYNIPKTVTVTGTPSKTSSNNLNGVPKITLPYQNLIPITPASKLNSSIRITPTTSTQNNISGNSTIPSTVTPVEIIPISSDEANKVSFPIPTAANSILQKVVSSSPTTPSVVRVSPAVISKVPTFQPTSLGTLSIMRHAVVKTLPSPINENYELNKHKLPSFARSSEVNAIQKNVSGNSTISNIGLAPSVIGRSTVSTQQIPPTLTTFQTNVSGSQTANFRFSPNTIRPPSQQTTSVQGNVGSPSNIGIPPNVIIRRSTVNSQQQIPPKPTSIQQIDSSRLHSSSIGNTTHRAQIYRNTVSPLSQAQSEHKQSPLTGFASISKSLHPNIHNRNTSTVISTEPKKGKPINQQRPNSKTLISKKNKDLLNNLQNQNTITFKAVGTNGNRSRTDRRQSRTISKPTTSIMELRNINGDTIQID